MDKIMHVIRFDWSTTKAANLYLLAFFFTFGLYYAVMARDLNLLPMSLMIWAAFSVGLPFSVNMKQGVDNLLATLPVTRKTVVAGRFAYAVLGGFVCLSLSEIMVCLAAAVFHVGFEMGAVSLTLCFGFLLFALVISIQLPMYFRYRFAIGIQLSTLFLFVVFVTLYQLGMTSGFLPVFMRDASITAWRHPFIPIAATLALSSAFIAASFLMSCKLYTNRDL